jgi:hypothetical protein
MEDLTPPKKNLVIANMVVVAAADVLLTIGLCVLLWSTYLEVVSGTAGAKSCVYPRSF